MFKCLLCAGATLATELFIRSFHLPAKPSMPLPPASTPSIYKWHSSFPSYNNSLLTPVHDILPFTSMATIKELITCLHFEWRSMLGNEWSLNPSTTVPRRKPSPLRRAGFAFVYFDDERDAEDAVRGLDGTPFGYNRRKISVEWARQGDRGRHRDSSRAMANLRPTKTLFVINFDPIHTRVRDVERHFEPYGNVIHVRIRRNFAFVQFETQEEATKALECTHMSKIRDRVVSVEYALRDDGDRGRDSSPRGGGGYGRRESPVYGRSPSPVRRRGPGRPSPDYGRAHSPVYDRYNGPVYGRNRSPDYGRYRSPDYGRYPSRSPIRRSRT